MESATLQTYLHLAICAPSLQIKLGRLLRRFGSLNSLLTTLQCQAPQADSDNWLFYLRAQGGCDKCKASVEDALRWQEQQQNALICYEDPRYPVLLKEIDDPPPLLYIQGNSALLAKPQIAIIGSRRASNYGLRNAFWLGQELSKLGITVTSGMAAGIDSRAHEGALNCGGATIAVVGTGIEGCYPRKNRVLKQQIAERGAIVSEFPMGSPPHSFHFPQRNRVISGLSVGVVVIEAALKSGSLITARLAMEQNRDVFALPGLITNPMAQGCHHLINEGVKLVQSVEDIAHEIGFCWQAEEVMQNELIPVAATNNAERLVLNALKAEPATLDYLLASTTIPEEELISCLSGLEAKRIIQFSHGRYNYLRRV